MATVTLDKPKDAIAALLQERQRYEQWLAVLDSRRATTPPHVHARVRADYEGRLARVVDELGGRTAELRHVVDALAQQVAALQSEETTKRDSQSEAELRAAVGEYTPEQWREVSQSSDAEIARIAAQRADAASELAQVQQLLNMATVRRPAPPASAVSHPESSAGTPAAAGPRPSVKQGERAAADGSPADVGRSAQPVRAPGQANFDELAFLHSVVEPKPSASSAGPPPRPSGAQSAARPLPPTTAAPAAGTTPRPRTPAVSASPAPGAQPAPAAAARPPAPPPALPPPLPPVARPVVTPPEAAMPIPLGTGQESTGRGTMDTGSVPVFLRDVPSEQVKTLKCAECGTMNYPTEWYCERCGGELAAM